MQTMTMYRAATRVVVPLFARRSFVSLTANRTSSRGLITRGYSTLSTQKQTAKLITYVDEEIENVKGALAAEKDATDDEKWTKAKEFEQRYNFQLTEDQTAKSVKLTRTYNDKAVTISFSSTPSDTWIDNEMEEEAMAGEGEGEEEGNVIESKREQPFRVEIEKPGKANSKMIFDCYATGDGSFTVTHLNSGSGDRVPVSIGDWSEELQQSLLAMMEPYGVEEGLSFFIHTFLDRRLAQHNLETMKEFKAFLEN